MGAGERSEDVHVTSKVDTVDLDLLRRIPVLVLPEISRMAFSGLIGKL